MARWPLFAWQKSFAMATTEQHSSAYERAAPLLERYQALEQQGHGTPLSLLRSGGSFPTLRSSGLFFFDPLLALLFHVAPFRRAVLALRPSASCTAALNLQVIFARLALGVCRSVEGSEALLESLGWEVEAAIARHDVAFVVRALLAVVAGAEQEDTEEGAADGAAPPPFVPEEVFGGRWSGPAEGASAAWVDLTLPIPSALRDRQAPQRTILKVQTVKRSERRGH